MTGDASSWDLSDAPGGRIAAVAATILVASAVVASAVAATEPFVFARHEAVQHRPCHAPESLVGSAVAAATEDFVRGEEAVQRRPCHAPQFLVGSAVAAATEDFVRGEAAVRRRPCHAPESLVGSAVAAATEDFVRGEEAVQHRSCHDPEFLVGTARARRAVVGRGVQCRSLPAARCDRADRAVLRAVWQAWRRRGLEIPAHLVLGRVGQLPRCRADPAPLAGPGAATVAAAG